VQRERYRRLEAVAAGYLPSVPSGRCGRDTRRPFVPPRTWRVKWYAMAVAALLLLAALVVEVPRFRDHCTQDEGLWRTITSPLREDGLDLLRTGDRQCVGLTDRPGPSWPVAGPDELRGKM
ncbi:MAG: hypothetical protein ACRDSN_04710, partial [Pseudonocardiaceae bacterium]